MLVTTSNEYRQLYGGGLFGVLWTDVTLENVVMIAKSKSGTDDIGYVAGCAKSTYKVTNVNCYYILIPNDGKGGTFLPIGLRNTYINSAEDSQAAMTGTFETYANVSDFESDSTKTLSTQLTNMYDKYVA